jgi:ElaB/YqjD/DUF883 family membrane-anchored ribosome-binding protein
MIYRFLEWWGKWVKENPFLAIYIGIIKGILIGIIICQYLIR